MYYLKRPVDFGAGLRAKEIERDYSFAGRSHQRHEKTVMAVKIQKCNNITIGSTNFAFSAERGGYRHHQLPTSTFVACIADLQIPFAALLVTH